MGLGFNRFIKNQKKENKKAKEEQMIRLNSIIAEIQSVCSKRGVNHYELMDILHSMRGGVNEQIAIILKKNSLKINEYRGLLSKNNIKFEKDDREQSK